MKILAFALTAFVVGAYADAMLPARSLQEDRGPTMPLYGRDDETKNTHRQGDELRRVYVRYAAGDHDAALRAVERFDKDHKMKQHYDFKDTNSIVVTVSENELRDLQNDPSVQSIVEDPKRFLHGDRNLRSRQRNMLQWQGQARDYFIEMVQAGQAWEEGLTGAGIKVCVIDTGFDHTHEDFDLASITGESLDNGSAWSTDGIGHGKSSCEQSADVLLLLYHK